VRITVVKRTSKNVLRCKKKSERKINVNINNGKSGENEFARVYVYLQLYLDRRPIYSMHIVHCTSILSNKYIGTNMIFEYSLYPVIGV